MKTLIIFIQSGITWYIIYLFCRYVVWPVIEIFLIEDVEEPISFQI